MTITEFEHISLSLRPLLQSIGQQFFADGTRGDDVAQEILMRLWLMRDRICMAKGVEPLAVRMAKNYCVNEWRRQQRMLSVEKIADVAATTQADDIAERYHQLQKAIENLPPSAQRLFRMRYEWDLSVEEIAAIMGISPRSVSSIVSTAKRTIKEQLVKGGLL